MTCLSIYAAGLFITAFVKTVYNVSVIKKEREACRLYENIRPPRQPAAFGGHIMDPVILLCAAVALSCAKSLLFRGVAPVSEGRSGFWLVNAVIFASAFAVLSLCGLVSGGATDFSLYSLCLSLLFAAVTIAAQVCYIKAQSRGPVSLNTFIYSCGFIIPTFYGAVSDREMPAPAQLAGLLLLLAVLYVYILPSRGAFDGVWILYISAATLSSGVIGILQKLHQASGHAAELDGFLLSSFAVCAAVSLALYIFTRAGTQGATGASPLTRRALPFALASGIVIALLNRVNLYLAGALPSVIFYPVYNGAVTLTAGVAAFFIYRERLKPRQIVCLGFGIAAIALINLRG